MLLTSFQRIPSNMRFPKLSLPIGRAATYFARTAGMCVAASASYL